jgi:3-phosphoshikimate 1-carboxyvinyltransferase
MTDALLINPASAGLRGELGLPGDKSISHRAVMFGAVAHGQSRIRNCSLGGDNRSTIGAFRELGVEIAQDGTELIVTGRGWDGLRAPSRPLACGNSGTTTRLLCGVLSGRGFASRLDGDASLRSRPMGRVIDPLRQMGARITGEGGTDRVPLHIHGLGPAQALQAIRYRSPVASAQVKSAILLAGLQARGTTQVWEPVRSRDHTERLLTAFGGRVEVRGTTVCVAGGQQLHACELEVPGDLSSAAFFIGAGLIVPHSALRVCGVGVNPTRTGVLDIFRAMGASLRIDNQRQVGGEPVGDVVVRSSRLRGTRIDGELVVRAIDEFPIIAVAAACAEGTTVIRGAQELRVKESDRLQTIASALQALGVGVTELPDGLIIEGRPAPDQPLRAATVSSGGDHRIAMALSVAGLRAAGPLVLDQASCVDISFPGFHRVLQELGGGDLRAVQ